MVTVTPQAAGGGTGGAPPAGPQTIYEVYADQLDTPRMITDQAGNVVWQWDDEEAFGNNSPNQSSNGGGSFVFNLRFTGQYADIETGTFYNYFRDYDPSIGRYIESDPIGLFGGQVSTYSYVDGNLLSNIDPNGLAIVIGYPTGNSVADKAWYEKYRALIRANVTMENRLKSLCGPDRDKLLDIFNKWKISEYVYRYTILDNGTLGNFGIKKRPPEDAMLSLAGAGLTLFLWHLASMAYAKFYSKEALI